MSATLRVIQATATERGQWIDRLGYGFCDACQGFAPGAQWSTTYHDDDRCEMCGVAIADAAPRVITGTATIEYFQCRIF